MMDELFTITQDELDDLIAEAAEREIRRVHKAARSAIAKARDEGREEGREEVRTYLRAMSAFNGSGGKVLAGLGSLFKSQWDESKHLRDHGKFSSSPGEDGNADESHADSKSLIESAHAVASRIIEAFKNLSGSVINSARSRAKSAFEKLSKRYGPDYARLAVAAGLVGMAVPAPGASLIAAAPIVAVAELHRQVNGGEVPALAIPKGIKQAASWLVRQVSGGVQTKSDPDDAAELPNMDAAFALALIDLAIDAKENETDPVPALSALQDLIDDPTQLADALRNGDVDDDTIAKSVGWSFLSIMKAWSEELHPRDKNGRFISKDALKEAQSNPEKAAELRERVRPEDSEKLEKVISGENDPCRTKRGEAKARVEQIRQDKAAVRDRVKELRLKVSKLEATPEDLHELAELIPHLTIAELRTTRQLMAQEGAGFGGAKRRDEMVAALVGHAKRIAEEKRKEAADEIDPLDFGSLVDYQSTGTPREALSRWVDAPLKEGVRASVERGEKTAAEEKPAADSAEEAARKIGEYERQRAEDQRIRDTTWRVGDKIEAYIAPPGPFGHEKPRVKVEGRVTTLDTASDGVAMARIEYTDAKGKERSAYLRMDADTWRQVGATDWNKPATEEEKPEPDDPFARTAEGDAHVAQIVAPLEKHGNAGEGTADQIKARLNARGAVLDELRKYGQSVGTKSRMSYLDKFDEIRGDNRKDLEALDRVEARNASAEAKPADAKPEQASKSHTYKWGNETAEVTPETMSKHLSRARSLANGVANSMYNLKTGSPTSSDMPDAIRERMDHLDELNAAIEAAGGEPHRINREYFESQLESFSPSESPKTAMLIPSEGGRRAQVVNFKPAAANPEPARPAAAATNVDKNTDSDQSGEMGKAITRVGPEPPPGQKPDHLSASSMSRYVDRVASESGLRSQMPLWFPSDAAKLEWLADRSEKVPEYLRGELLARSRWGRYEEDVRREATRHLQETPPEMMTANAYLQTLVNADTRDMWQVGDEGVFFRAGKLPPANRSRNGATGQLEPGVSVYPTPHATSIAGLSDRPWYMGKGKVVAVGSDDEPIVQPTDKWSKLSSEGENPVVAFHRKTVEAALKYGRNVPPEVLADYPDLAAKYGGAKADAGGLKEPKEPESQAKKSPDDAGRTISQPEDKPMPATKEPQKKADASSLHGTITDLYNRAASPTVTEDQIRAATNQLPGLPKADLVKIAEGVGLFGMGAKSKPEVVKEITERIIERKGASIRRKLIDRPDEESPAAKLSRKIKNTIEATSDPAAVSDDDVKSLMNEITKLPEADQIAMAREVTGKGGRTAKQAQQYMLADLTAVKRALESQRV